MGGWIKKKKKRKRRKRREETHIHPPTHLLTRGRLVSELLVKVIHVYGSSAGPGGDEFRLVFLLQDLVGGWVGGWVGG